jgi:regulator of ribonuclease activity A
VSFATPDLCDENAEIVSVMMPMLRNFGGRDAFYGQIVTIKCYEDNSLVKDQANEAGQGRVMVVDGGGSLRCALLGDLIATKACENGWAGLIIYGCIRDVDAIAQLELGVQAINSIPLKSVRKGRGDLNLDICFGGVTFKPGHYVYADNNGVITAPVALKLP